MNGALQNFLATTSLLLGPIVIFGIYKLRRYTSGIRQAERDARPYNPRPEPKPGLLLRQFSAPEQKYLRQLLGPASYIFLCLSWFWFGIFVFPTLNIVFTHNTWNNPRAFLWFRILLQSTSLVGTSCIFLGLAAASLVIPPLRFGTAAQFFRTRPLGIGFLFWTILMVALGTELASIFTGTGAAFLLLAAIHGPIWLHLPPAFPGVLTPNDGRPALYAALLATSPPRIFLSICTTTALSLSLFAFLMAIPSLWRGGQSSRPNVLPVLAMGSAIAAWLVFNLARIFVDVRLPPWLFVYLELGPPPPYAFALIPVVLSAGMLLLARYFVGKSEV